MSRSLSCTKTGLGETGAEPKRTGCVKVIFRYDDIYLQGGNSERDSLDLKVINLFVREGVPISVAVVPGDMQKLQMSQEAPGDSGTSKSLVMPFILAHRDLIDICQHGYCHSHYLAASISLPTEFAERPSADQRSDIEKGRALLSAAGIADVSAFIPPFNTFDQGTLDALAAAGFRGMSAGITRYGTRAPDGFAFVPAQNGLWGIADTIQLSRKIHEVVFFVALFHNYNVKEREDPRGILSLHELEVTLQRLKREPNISFLTISQAIAAAPERFSMSTFRACSLYRDMWRFYHHVPLFKRLLLYRFAYWPVVTYWKYVVALLIITAIVLGLAGAIVTWVFW